MELADSSTGNEMNDSTAVAVVERAIAANAIAVKRNSVTL